MARNINNWAILLFLFSKFPFIHILCEILTWAPGARILDLSQLKGGKMSTPPPRICHRFRFLHCIFYWKIENKILFVAFKDIINSRLREQVSVFDQVTQYIAYTSENVFILIILHFKSNTNYVSSSSRFYLMKKWKYSILKFYCELLWKIIFMQDSF